MCAALMVADSTTYAMYQMPGDVLSVRGIKLRCLNCFNCTGDSNSNTSLDGKKPHKAYKHFLECYSSQQSMIQQQNGDKSNLKSSNNNLYRQCRNLEFPQAFYGSYEDCLRHEKQINTVCNIIIFNKQSKEQQNVELFKGISKAKQLDESKFVKISQQYAKQQYSKQLIQHEVNISAIDPIQILIKRFIQAQNTNQQTFPIRDKQSTMLEVFPINKLNRYRTTLHSDLQQYQFKQQCFLTSQIIKFLGQLINRRIIDEVAKEINQWNKR
eukprot:403341634